MSIEIIQAAQEQTNQALAAIKTQLSEQSEKFIAAREADGKNTAEAKARIDELLSKHGELTARLTAAEQALVAKRSDDAEAIKSAGRAFVEAHASTLSSNMRAKLMQDFPRAAITSVTAPGIVQPDHRGLLPPKAERLTIRDLLMGGTTDSNLVSYVKETGFTNNAKEVAEGALKPMSGLEFTPSNAEVVTIAHWIPASKQILDDASALASYIDGRMRQGLLLAEEKALLFGAGTSGTVHGLVPQAQDFEAAIQVVDETVIDRIRLAMLQSMLAEYAADGIVLNPTDWALIQMTKDKEGRYIVGNAVNSNLPLLWNVPVVETTGMTAGNFLTGAFGSAAQIFDREGITVEVSTEDSDNFRKNMVTIRAEERLAMAVYRPEAFVTGTTVAAGEG